MIGVPPDRAKIARVGAPGLSRMERNTLLQHLHNLKDRKAPEKREPPAEPSIIPMDLFKDVACGRRAWRS